MIGPTTRRSHYDRQTEKAFRHRAGAADLRRDARRSLIRRPRLPVEAARQVICSLLAAGSGKEVPAPIQDGEYAWRTGAGITTAATPIETAVDALSRRGSHQAF
jgi:hypothetical protein